MFRATAGHTKRWLRKMKTILTVLLIAVSSGCVQIQNPEMKPVQVLTNQLDGKKISKIEIYNIITGELNGTILDKGITHEFRASLTTCKPIPQIDTMGSHSIIVYSENERIRFDTDFFTFIRLPEYNGQDAYFECSPEMNSILRKIKANQGMDLTR